MPVKNRFVIGIGSQRAGSTLLHSLLEASTNIFMHPVKELHYFDTLHQVRPQQALTEFSLRQLTREIDNLVAATNYKHIDKRYKCYLRANRLLGLLPISEVNYLDLFRPCVAGYEMLGETTPEYMLLDDKAITSMKATIGEDAVILLICRHPVKRLLSAVKLMNVYNRLGMDDQGAEQWLQQQLDKQSSWVLAQDRYNDYETAIRRFEGHFKHFMALSYDELVLDAENVARRLQDLLDTPVDTTRFVEGAGKVKNNLGENLQFSDRMVERLQGRYEASICFLDGLFPNKAAR